MLFHHSSAVARLDALADLLESLMFQSAVANDVPAFNLYGEAWADVDHALSLLAGNERCTTNVPLPTGFCATPTTPRTADCRAE